MIYTIKFFGTENKELQTTKRTELFNLINTMPYAEIFQTEVSQALTPNGNKIASIKVSDTAVNLTMLFSAREENV